MAGKIENISVLIAEDEDALLQNMREYLELFFNNVYTAHDGLSAYELYNTHRPDIIIADINMPKLDGLSMIEKIRKKDKDVKIIITSAHSEQEKLLQAIELHLVKYLIKPVQSDMLKNLLLSVVDEIEGSLGRILLKEDYSFDDQSMTLYKKEEVVELKEKEKKVLQLLCQKANQNVSVYDIHNALYEDDIDKEFSSNAITSLIKRLRPKLPKETLSSVYGVGYILYLR